jgi:GMP reductase
MTGVGFPQFSAVQICVKEARQIPGLSGIVADGGCVHPGDVSKAFAAGAQMVMLGGMLAGHDEAGGWVFDYTTNTMIPTFYGMASEHAMQTHYNQRNHYRAAEGKRVVIEPKGPVENTVREIMGGVRSACTYVGAKNLDELSKNSGFIKVNRQYNTAFGD